MKTVNAFESIHLEELSGSNQLVHELINHPFHQHESKYFVNQKWISVEVANDFFVEIHNWKLIQRLMELSGEAYCLLHNAHAYITNTTYGVLTYDADINELRTLLIENSLFVMDWAFISVTKKWACLSVNDGSSLYIGYDSLYKNALADSIKESPDFVKYL